MTLQQCCAARGLTLEQLAERAGVALTTAVKIDQGTLRVHPLTRRRLAAVLGIGAVAVQAELSEARRRHEIPRPPETAWRYRRRMRRTSGPCGASSCAPARAVL